MLARPGATAGCLYTACDSSCIAAAAAGPCRLSTWHFSCAHQSVQQFVAHFTPCWATTDMRASRNIQSTTQCACFHSAWQVLRQCQLTSSCGAGVKTTMTMCVTQAQQRLCVKSVHLRQSLSVTCVGPPQQCCDFPPMCHIRSTHKICNAHRWCAYDSIDPFFEGLKTDQCH